MRYCDITRWKPAAMSMRLLTTICAEIQKLLVAGIESASTRTRRSASCSAAGLDSSSCAPLRQDCWTDRYAHSPLAGLDAIDLKYARTVAAYINSEHTEVIISRGDVLGALEHVVSVSEPTTSQPSARA